MAQIFLSYSHSDGDFVELIEPRIARIFGEGLLWYDRSPDGLKGGQIWWSEILREIQQCQILLFLLSDESAKSEWCSKELEEAVSLNKTIIPVFLETYSSKDYPANYSQEAQNRLGETHYVDLRNKSRFKYDDLSPLWGAINQAQRPSLSSTERWLLYNQYRIIGLLDNDIRKLNWDETVEQRVLSYGFEHHYDEISSFLESEMSFNMGRELNDILFMYGCIENARMGVGHNESAVDFSNIDETYLRFRGFDANIEPQYFGYATFLLSDLNYYEESRTNYGKYNSHCLMLPIYQRMLTAWRESKHRFCLTREDVYRIASAALPNKK